jgi:putative ABC transport system ATP-binding protein/lipoprotein-releasing system ATP-binding protein
MLVDCIELQKNYISNDKNIKAVDNVSLQIQSGDFVIILGHSGSGKTTLLSLIGGLTYPDKGKVLIHETDNLALSDQDLSILRNRTIGFIFQFASLIPSLTVLENLLLPLSFGGKKVGIEANALDLLRQVGLSDKANVFPSQLSGGQQRRVAIARSFVNNPEIILADEPTGDLDEETENDILKSFRKFNEKGTTFVVVTHNKNLGKTQRNPRIIHMRNGVVTEED